ncbi:GTP-binding protein, partial [candidate division WOR-3 bacterium]|nr:GTP-binding protein [candidate division WOR-3 bacterium]
MTKITAADIKNLAIVGHSSVGKTTLGEAILFNAKETTRLNRVNEKNSVLDFNDEEMNRSITVALKLATLKWNNKTINFLDTPGFPDFYGEVVSASKVTESFMIVVDSQAGVDLGTEKAWDLVNKENLAVMFVVNKMTRENIEIDKIINDIKESLSDKATLIQLPLGIGPDFKGIIDIVTGKAFEYKDGIAKETAVPADMNERVETMRTELIEKIAESDESLMEKFFEESLSDDDITKGFNTAIKAGNIYPICFADAHENIGTDKIMDVISNYLPSAADKEEYACKDGSVKIGDAFSGFIFKTTVEKHVGDMAYLRIFSGELKPGSEVINIEKGSSEKINQVYTVVGKNRKEVDCLPAGGMCILVKLKNSTTNDSLVDKTVKKQFNKIEFPKANVSMAIVPQTKGDEEKISNGLQKLSDEDPSFYYNFDPEIRQTLIHGLGTIHLEVIVNKLKEKFGVNVTLKKPRIKYRETITKEASAEGKHKKQSG